MREVSQYIWRVLFWGERENSTLPDKNLRNEMTNFVNSRSLCVLCNGQIFRIISRSDKFPLFVRAFNSLLAKNMHFLWDIFLNIRNVSSIRMSLHKSINRMMPIIHKDRGDRVERKSRGGGRRRRKRRRGGGGRKRPYTLRYLRITQIPQHKLKH